MLRYVVIVLFFVATLPLVPHFLAEMTPQTDDGEMSEEPGQAERANGPVHRIMKRADGSYRLEGQVNGRKVEMLVDTGASHVALPQTVARKAGIFLQPSDFKIEVRTANGSTRAAPTRLREIEIGRIHLKNIDALVLDDDALSVTLLGMSALHKLDRFDFSNDTLLLVQ
ncbi:retropepsin-like aspartic protease family protein [Roseibium sp.]|uniref:retropepsin-like aspartic protease family protein n=1 Tax=Roseibium sp. TaxID=1936156 RepID=UPI003A97D214